MKWIFIILAVTILAIFIIAKIYKREWTKILGYEPTNDEMDIITKLEPNYSKDKIKNMINDYKNGTLDKSTIEAFIKDEKEASKKLKEELKVIETRDETISDNNDISEQLRKSFIAYFDDKISAEKLFEDIGHTSTTSVSSIYYAGFFQVAVPIPFLGAFIGAFVGYTLGSMLYDTGLFSFTGDSEIVKIAKDKRAKLERISNTLIPIIEKSRIDFEKYVDKYFADRKKYFDNMFNKIDNSIIDGKYQDRIDGLSKISIALTNKDISSKSNKEFKKFLESNKK